MNLPWTLVYEDVTLKCFFNWFIVCAAALTAVTMPGGGGAPPGTPSAKPKVKRF